MAPQKPELTSLALSLASSVKLLAFPDIGSMKARSGRPSSRPGDRRTRSGRCLCAARRISGLVASLALNVERADQVPLHASRAAPTPSRTEEPLRHSVGVAHESPVSQNGWPEGVHHPDHEAVLPRPGRIASFQMHFEHIRAEHEGNKSKRGVHVEELLGWWVDV